MNKKTVIVTGGSNGIGKCIVEELSKKGHNVILNYYKSENNAKLIQDNLRKNGIEIDIFKADVSKREEVRKLVEYVLNKYKNIDVLINNAGISQTKLFTDITDQDWNTMLDTNLNSVFYMTQEVLPNMIHNKNGCIINISSVWGMVGASCEVHYAVSKAGIDAMTKSLAKELGPSNIRVNSIAPGIIETNMIGNLNEEEIDNIKQEIPLEKIGKPDNISKCVSWLIEDEYTTGQVISINGGWIV